MLVPTLRPRLSRAEVEEIAARELIKFDLSRERFPCVMLGIRGYYKNSMGVSGQNDRGIYDDALFICTPNAFLSVNANCDASKYRKGWGFGREKGMASLAKGVWMYQPGIHRTYAAFRQAAAVLVNRDGTKGDYSEVGWFGINIHKGGTFGTSSLGCQTIPPSQWASFKELMYGQLKMFGQKTFPYILIDESEIKLG